MKRKGKLSVMALAAGVGISDTTLKKYFSRGCPRTSIKAVKKWRAKNIRSTCENADGSEIGIALKRAELAERLENAKGRKLKNDNCEARLISSLEVDGDLSAGLECLETRLNQLGGECETAVEGPAELKTQIRECVDETVRLALREFRDDLRI